MIDELVSHHQVARRDLLLHAPRCAHRYQPFDAKFFHPPQVGAIIQLARRYSMTAAVARQENDFDLAQVAAIVDIRRSTERCVESDRLDSLESTHLINPAAPDYA